MGIGQRLETSSAFGLSAIVVSEITHNHKIVSIFSKGLDLYNARSGLGSIVGLRFFTDSVLNFMGAGWVGPAQASQQVFNATIGSGRQHFITNHHVTNPYGVMIWNSWDGFRRKVTTDSKSDAGKKKLQ